MSYWLMLFFTLCCAAYPVTVVADMQSLMEPMGEVRRNSMLRRTSDTKPAGSIPVGTQKALRNVPSTPVDVSIIRESDILRVLEQIVAQKYALKGQVKLFFSQPFHPIKINPQGWQIELLQVPADKVSERFTISFRVKQKEDIAGEYTIPVRAELWQPSYVAEKAIAKGAVLDPKDFIVREVDVLRIRGVRVPVDVRLDTFIADQNIPAGDVLVMRDLKRKPLIYKDQMVDVVAQEGGLHIKMRAKAMQDGMQGDVIEVVNISSRKSVYAQVISENTLKIEF